MLGNFYLAGFLWKLKAQADDKGGTFAEPKIINVYAVEWLSVQRARRFRRCYRPNRCEGGHGGSRL